MPFFQNASASIVSDIRLMNLLVRCRARRLAGILSRRMQRRFGVYISIDATIPSTVRFPHPVGIIIGRGVIIGERVTVYQNVTLGGRDLGDAYSGNYPAIGNDTVIFAGAVIAGQVHIGKECRVGANAVVLTNVPDGATAVGVPARVVLRAALS